MDFQLFILALSTLIFFGILIYNPAKTYGIPAALVFIGIGLFFGNEYDYTPAFDYPEPIEFVSQMCLNLIIFTGGLHTPYKRIKAVFIEGLVLSNIAVFITAMLLGYFVSLVTPLSLVEGLLLGAIVSSTDAAAVFSVLEAKKLNLKYNTDKALEFESATNDPMAMILTLIFTGILLEGGQVNYGQYIIYFFMQLSIGGAAGYVFALLLGFIFKKVTFREKGLIPIFILTSVFITTLGANALHGNILVASYVLGIMLSGQVFANKTETMDFFNSFSWLAQSTMFMILGLQIFPSKLLNALSLSWAATLFLFFIGRPIGVFLSYIPFKAPIKKQAFVSLIGLKGATPIVFALIPLIKGAPKSELIFNIVSIIVICSLIFHSMSLDFVARKLDLVK